VNDGTDLDELADQLAQITCATQGQDYLARCKLSAVEFVSPPDAKYIHQHRDAGARERDLLARIAEVEAEDALKQEMLTMISTRVQMWADRNAELVAENDKLLASVEMVEANNADLRALIALRAPAPLPDVSRETFPPNALKHSR
jgi:hypothetical protein